MEDKKKTSILLIVSLLLIIFIFLILLDAFEGTDIFDDYSASEGNNDIEEIGNLSITEANREVTVSSYDIITVTDNFEIENLNSFAINLVYIGIPKVLIPNLLSISCTDVKEESDDNRNDLNIKQIDFDSENCVLFEIDLNESLNEEESKSIKMIQTFTNQLVYESYGDYQLISYSGYVFPFFPYQINSSIVTTYEIDSINFNLDSYDWGTSTGRNTILFNSSQLNDEDGYIEPFLKNLGDDLEISLSYEEMESTTKLQVKNVDCEIEISPWGVIKVKEEMTLYNAGKIELSEIVVKIPSSTKCLTAYDDLGEIMEDINKQTTESKGNEQPPEGVQPPEGFQPPEGWEPPEGLEPPSGGEFPGRENIMERNTGDELSITIDLTERRAPIYPNRSMEFTLEFFITYDDYISFNFWTLQNTLYIDALLVKFDYIVQECSIEIVLEACANIYNIDNLPSELSSFSSGQILIYKINNISPSEDCVITLTYSINYFDLMYRPLIFSTIIALTSTIFTLLSLFLKKKKVVEEVKREELPLEELRAFNSLYERKINFNLELNENIELLEMKKMKKQNFNVISKKIEAKLKEINLQIIPFKEILKTTNQKFQDLIEALDVLESEKESITDALSILEKRYNQKKITSKQAYENLSDDFFRRKKKIEKKIEQTLNTLKSME